MTCPRCGKENPEGFAFCGRCGAPLEDASSAWIAERRVVTILFCDMVGFTPWSERSDPEDVQHLQDRYFPLLQRAVEAHGGTISQFTGDGAMAVFGAPVAHEDDGARAVRSGLRILDDVEDLNRTEPRLALVVRLGINTGEGLVRTRADGAVTVSGDVVNTAQRLQTAAAPGAIVVGEATYLASRSMFDYQSLDPVEVKGKSLPLHIWRPRSELRDQVPFPAPRPSSPFVGRDDELKLLELTFSRATRDRSCQLVTVLGEPGIGKSRLIAELRPRLPSPPGGAVIWRQGQCLPYGESITFWALGEIVKDQANILVTDPPAAVRSKLARAIPDGGDKAWLVERLLPLVGLEASSAAERSEAFAAWRRFIESIAETGPTVLVVEDLHWADESMLDFLEYLTDHTEGVPLLIACTARPELLERHPGWAGGMRNATTIDLASLTADDVAELVSGLLQGAQISDAGLASLMERAGGNPLFAEELVGLLKDQGKLVSENGTMVLLDGGEGRLPASIAALISARVDTLSPDRKSLLSDAAVVGSVFWLGALAWMADGRDESSVADAMHEMVRMEFVRPARDSSIHGESEFVFWHVLVRDVAYARLPRAARAAKHLSVARWMERVAADRLEDVAEILASHYTEAISLLTASGQDELARERTPDAVRFLALAGDRALGLDGMRAEAYYRQAMELAPSDHPERSILVGKVAETAHINGRSAEAVELYEQAIALSKERDDTTATAELTIRYSVVLASLGQTELSTALLDALIRELEPRGPSPQLALAYAERAYPFGGLPYEEALALANKALALADRLDLPAVRARALDFRAGARIALGDPGGLEELRAGLELSLALRLTRQTYVTYINMVALMTYQDPAGALDVAGEGLRYVGERGLAEGDAWIRAYRLQAMFQLGQWNDLLHSSEELTRWASDHGYERNVIMAAYPKALVLMIRGRLSESERLARRYRESATRMRIGELFDLPFIAVLSSSGKQAEAAAEIEAMLTAFEADPNGSLEQSCEGARWSVAAGRPDLVPRIERLLVGELALARNSRLTCQALAAESDGRFRDALDAFTTSATEWSHFGNPYELGQARIGQARCLLGLNRPHEAVPVANEAAETMKALGAKPVARQAARIIGQVRAVGR